MPSTVQNVAVPEGDIWELLFESLEKPYSDNKVLFHDTVSERSYTFQQLQDTAIQFGAALHSSWDWQKGDILAVFSPNDVDYAPVAFGCLWAGGIVTTASPTYTHRELAIQLKNSGARAVVTTLPLVGIALKAAAEVGIAASKVILMGSVGFDSDLQHFRSLARNELSAKIEPRRRPYSLDPPNDLSFLVYSSGTTGKPKGVMLTHRNIVSNLAMMAATQTENLSCGNGETGSGDRCIGFVPMYHILGLTVILHLSIYRGYEVFVMPAFEIEKFCSIVQRHRITFITVVPRIILALAKHPVVDKFDLSSLRMLTSAAAPLSKDLVETMYQRLNIPVIQAYGLSETSPGSHFSKWEEWERSMGSIGRPLPNLECKVVSIDSGEQAGVGQIGELWLRGPNVFKGYLNNPTATSESLTPDGWFRTGDVGYFDGDGLYYITDRLKEMIKFNGFQVAPAELEGLLVSHPKIKDAAVVGVYDSDTATELPRAYVVVEEGVERGNAAALEISKWLNERVANHKRLRGGVHFIDVVPASTAGKILRRELRNLASKDQEARVLKL